MEPSQASHERQVFVELEIQDSWIQAKGGKDSVKDTQGVGVEPN